MRIIYPDVTETVHAIIRTRAVPVHAMIAHTIACTLCSGYNPLCSGCHGLGSQRVYDTVTFSGLIRWDQIDEKRATAVGLVYRGDAVCTVPHTDTVYSGNYSAYSGEYALLQRTAFYRVDTAIFEPIAQFFEGRPYNRIVVVLRQVDAVKS